MEISVKNIQGDEKKFEVLDKDVRDYFQENWEEVEEKANLALKIGVGAIKASTTTVDTNYVDKEFQKLSREFNERFRKFQDEWDIKIRKVFGEDFRKMTDSMDPYQPGTPTKRMMDELDKKFNKVIEEMDPMDDRSPLGQLRKEMISHMQQVLKEVAVKRAIVEEKERGAAKGLEYEDEVFEALLELGQVVGDTVIPTGKEPGAGGNKKGDVVVEVVEVPNLKLVFEAKKRSISLTQKFYDDEIKGSQVNRGAEKAILVVHPDYNPGKVPFYFWKEAVVAEYDPEVGDKTALSVSYQLARKLAIHEARKGKGGIDLGRFKTQLGTMMAYVDHISKVEGGITNSMNSLDKVKKDLQDTKERLKDVIAELTKQLGGDEDEVGG